MAEYEDQVYSNNDYMLELMLSKCGNKKDTASCCPLPSQRLKCISKLPRTWW